MAAAIVTPSFFLGPLLASLEAEHLLLAANLFHPRRSYASELSESLALNLWCGACDGV